MSAKTAEDHFTTGLLFGVISGVILGILAGYVWKTLEWKHDAAIVTGCYAPTSDSRPHVLTTNLVRTLNGFSHARWHT